MTERIFIMKTFTFSSPKNFLTLIDSYINQNLHHPDFCFSFSFISQEQYGSIYRSHYNFFGDIQDFFLAFSFSDNIKSYSDFYFDKSSEIFETIEYRLHFPLENNDCVIIHFNVDDSFVNNFLCDILMKKTLPTIYNFS